MRKREPVHKPNYLNGIIVFVICLSIGFLSVGYSAFSASGRIENAMASVKPKASARITGVVLSGSTNGGVSSSEDYNIDKVFGSVSLPNQNSTVTYKINATVFYSTEMKISSITGLPSNLEYTLSGYTLDGTLCNSNNECNLGATDEFYLTIKYKSGGFDSSNTNYSYTMNFNFDQVQHVAKVNNHYYETLQNAVDAVPTNGDNTTVFLLMDTTESINVATGQNITFNLYNNTITGITGLAVIENYGTVRISNGTLTTTAAVSVINNNSSGVLYVSGGTLRATGSKQAVYNFGTVNISGGTFSNTSNNRPALHNLAGATMTITGGTITSNRYHGVENLGTLVIGEQGGTPSGSNPSITGLTYGVTSNGNWKYYDGIIKGKTAAINDESNISEIESGFEILHKNETISGNVYDTVHLAIVQTVTFDPNQGSVDEPTRRVEKGTKIGTLPVPTRTSYYFDAWYTDPDNGTAINKDTIINSDTTYYAHWIHESEFYVAQIGNQKYPTITAAISAASNGDTISLQRDTSEKVTVPASKTLTFDFSGHTLSNNGVSPVIENFGTLTIVGGTIESDTSQGIINNKSGARLTITGGTFRAIGTRQVLYVDGGTAEITGGTFTSTTNERATLQTQPNGTLIIKGGNIRSTGLNGVENNGNLTIGTKDGNINASSPVITGVEHGVKNNNVFKFYDGLLRGIATPINGTVNEIEDNSTIVNSTTVIDGVNYNTTTLN